VAIGFACRVRHRNSAATAALRFTTCHRRSPRVSACGPVLCRVIARRGVRAESSDRPRLDHARTFRTGLVPTRTTSSSSGKPLEYRIGSLLNTPGRFGLLIHERGVSHSQNGSAKRGERPVGGPAARGHWGDGGAATRGTCPESTVILPADVGTVDRQLDSIASVPSYFFSNFDLSSPANVGPLRWAHLCAYHPSHRSGSLKPLLAGKYGVRHKSTSLLLPLRFR
jgi:hypothetical protein